MADWKHRGLHRTSWEERGIECAIYNCSALLTAAVALKCEAPAGLATTRPHGVAYAGVLEAMSAEQRFDWEALTRVLQALRYTPPVRAPKMQLREDGAVVCMETSGLFEQALVCSTCGTEYLQQRIKGVSNRFLQGNGNPADCASCTSKDGISALKPLWLKPQLFVTFKTRCLKGVGL